MIKKFAYALVALAVALASLTLTTSSAVAAGAFTYEGTFHHRLRTRTYSTPDTGRHHLYVTRSMCPGPGSHMRARLVHERKWRGDEFYSWVRFPCGQDWQIWARSYKTGNFHWDIEKSGTSDTSHTWEIRGEITYPSRG